MVPAKKLQDAITDQILHICIGSIEGRNRNHQRTPKIKSEIKQFQSYTTIIFKSELWYSNFTNLKCSQMVWYIWCWKWENWFKVFCIEILGVKCSASKCKHNWSTEHIRKDYQPITLSSWLVIAMLIKLLPCW